MTGVEETLRDALAARAGVVTFDPHAYDAVVARRSRRRARWRAPVAVVAAAVAVLGLAVVAQRRSTPEVAPITGGPERLISLESYGGNGMFLRAVVRDPRDLSRPPLVVLDTQAYHPSDGIAAVGDGTFYVAVSDRSLCGRKLLRIDPDGATTPVATLAGDVQGLAVTRDGRRLAYTTQPRVADCHTYEDWLEVRTVEIASGAERTWRITGTRANFGDVTWSPDGRHLAFQIGLTVRTLDTAAPGGSIQVPELDPFRFSDRLSGRKNEGCNLTSPAYLPSGELAVVLGCRQTRVAVFDPARQTVGRTLFHLPYGPLSSAPWMTVDSTGTRALVGFMLPDPKHGDGIPAPYAMYYWDGDGDAVRVRGDGALVLAAW